MNFLVDLSGILGFFISIYVVIARHYENRKQIEIEINEYIEDNYMLIRFTNISRRLLILKPRTIILKYKKNSYSMDRSDYLGRNDIPSSEIKKFPEVLHPGMSGVIGIPIDEMKECLGIKTSSGPDTRDNVYPFQIWIKDQKGKKYKNKNYTYWESIDYIYNKKKIPTEL